MKFFWRNKIIAGLILLIIITLSLCLMAYGRIFNLWQLRFADLLYGHSEEPRRDIVLVEVDEKSLDDEIGLGAYQNWTRDYFATVLNHIQKYHPRLTVFDFRFAAAKTFEEDNSFLEALKAAKDVILIFFGTPNNFTNGYFSQKNSALALSPVLPLFANLPNVTTALTNLLRDPDDVARRFIPAIYDTEKNVSYEMLALSAARKVLGGEALPVQPLVKNNLYTLQLTNGKKIEIPLEDGQMLINFFSKMEGPRYPEISFVDVYKENYGGKSPEELFNNKIVLIGPTGYSLKDNFPTPVTSKVLMPGVELHANALQTILDQKFLRNLNFPEEIALILLFTIAATFTFMYARIRWSVLALVGSATIYSLVAKPFFDHGIILDLVHPYLALVIAFMACYIYRYVTEFREKMVLKGAFAKYVNPKVVEQIMAHPEQLKLGGEKRTLTVLFTDIAHFTSISEQLKPESLVALLNEYFQAMSEVILEEGGTLDKFEGDAIMAFFGAPLPQPDHALRACRAALKMRQKLALLLQKWSTDQTLPGGEKKPPIDFRCGINTGEVIVGNMGSNERFDYTVMGDAVNLASRLEGANKKYQSHTMVSEATWQSVKDQFEGRELDLIKVVGKAQPIKVYELLNAKGALVPEAEKLLQLYQQGMELYHQRKFAQALIHFQDLLKMYPNDGPSQLYQQRCEVLKDFPPAADWDGVFEMGSK